MKVHGTSKKIYIDTYIKTMQFYKMSKKKKKKKEDKIKYDNIRYHQ